MINIHFSKPRREVFSRPRRRDDEEQVQTGLALTPAQIEKMVNSGIPIAEHNLGLVYDEGYNALDFTPPLEYTRGIDHLGDLWEAQEKFKKQLKDGVRKAHSDGLFEQSNN